MRDRGVFSCLTMPEGAMPMWAWAVGVGKQVYPPQVGMSIGDGTPVIFFFFFQIN